MGKEYMYINSIFESNEWLEYSFIDNYREILLKKGDIVQGRWAFGYSKNKMGFKVISMPNGNQSCGPWIENFGGKKSTVLGRQNKLLESLIKRLPEYDYMKISMAPNIISAYPFYWNNVNYTTRYTYVLDTQNELSFIESEFDSNIRKDLNKARKNLVVEETTSLEISQFVNIHRMVFERTSLTYPYSEGYMKNFTQFFENKGLLKVITVKDKDENIHSQIILIDDIDTVQYVFGATNTKYRGSGSSSLALFEGIRIAKEKGKKFNFYGSMTRSIESYFRSFGADMIPYYSIEQMSKKYKSYRRIKKIFK